MKENAGGFPWRSGKTIVTSRFRKWMDSPGFGHSFEVGNFEVEEAHHYLQDRVNDWRGDDDGVARVAQRLAYFPLALASAVGCAKEYALSPSEYIQELDTNRSRILDKWNARNRTADEYPYELFEVVHATWQRLSEAHDAVEGFRVVIHHECFQLCENHFIILILILFTQHASARLRRAASGRCRRSGGGGLVHCV